jgi:cyclic pyranopterin phosphate synthase
VKRENDADQPAPQAASSQDDQVSSPPPQKTQSDAPSVDENKFHEELQQTGSESSDAAHIKIQDVQLLGDDFESAIEELGAMISSGSEEADSSKAKAASPEEKQSLQTPEPKVTEEAPANINAGDAKLSHVNEAGAAHMVDISDKGVTQRIATAEGFVSMQPETLAQIQQNAMKKGDVLATARIAGIMAAKKTSDLIPLCHPLPVTGVEVGFTPVTEPQTGILVHATVKVDGKTGVEMEALTAVSVSCLTIYDMAKAIDKGMAFSGVRLLEKTGGKSGTYRAPDAAEY